MDDSLLTFPFRPARADGTDSVATSSESFAPAAVSRETLAKQYYAQHTALGKFNTPLSRSWSERQDRRGDPDNFGKFLGPIQVLGIDIDREMENVHEPPEVPEKCDGPLRFETKQDEVAEAFRYAFARSLGDIKDANGEAILKNSWAKLDGDPMMRLSSLPGRSSAMFARLTHLQFTPLALFAPVAVTTEGVVKLRVPGPFATPDVCHLRPSFFLSVIRDNEGPRHFYPDEIPPNAVFTITCTKEHDRLFSFTVTARYAQLVDGGSSPALHVLVWLIASATKEDNWLDVDQKNWILSITFADGGDGGGEPGPGRQGPPAVAKLEEDTAQDNPFAIPAKAIPPDVDVSNCATIEEIHAAVAAVAHDYAAQRLVPDWSGCQIGLAKLMAFQIVWLWLLGSEKLAPTSAVFLQVVANVKPPSDLGNHLRNRCYYKDGPRMEPSDITFLMVSQIFDMAYWVKQNPILATMPVSEVYRYIFDQYSKGFSSNLGPDGGFKIYQMKDELERLFVFDVHFLCDLIRWQPFRTRGTSTGMRRFTLAGIAPDEEKVRVLDTHGNHRGYPKCGDPQHRLTSLEIIWDPFVV
ncbi:hypothetical protein LXA43DRAFT_1101936 [Ganoderma leucocontextum]|nr:hypothetical protein LXA43DRAFT_1101936 [Ganoderma leucocontextum]